MRKTVDLSEIYHAVINKELEIAPDGKIWRVAKRGWARWENKTVVRKCKRVRAEHDAGEYLMIRVMKNLKRLNVGAHRLVYYHFHGQIKDGLTVNHKNGKKKDNHPDNLELMTDKEQTDHVRNVLKIPPRNQNGEKNEMSKLTSDQIVEIINRRASGEKLNSIAVDYGIRFQHVSRLYKRERWKHLIIK